MSGGEEVYAPETGEFLGWAHEADDGATVLIDEAGDIIAAVDTEGNALDPAGYQTADEGGYDDDEVDDLEEQIAELQEWRENFDPIAMREEARAAGAAASGARGDEAWALDVGRQMRNLEEAIGRALTQGEVWTLLQEVRGDHEHGLPSDLTAAVERVGIVPFSPGRDFGAGDAQRTEGRQAYMRQLIEDSQREERGETPDDGPEWIEPASNDPGDVRRANLANAANGHEVDFNNQEDYE